MNMENRVRFDSIEHYPPNRDTIRRENLCEDEIDLGELLLNVAAEWKAMILVLLFGFLGSLAAALLLPRTCSVESILRFPTLAVIGELERQRLLEITPEQGFSRVVDQLHSRKIQERTLEGSDWLMNIWDTRPKHKQLTVI